MLDARSPAVMPNVASREQARGFQNQPLPANRQTVLFLRRPLKPPYFWVAKRLDSEDDKGTPLLDKGKQQVAGHRWDRSTCLWIEKALNVLLENAEFNDVGAFSYHGAEHVARVGHDGVRLVLQARANKCLRK